MTCPAHFSLPLCLSRNFCVTASFALLLTFSGCGGSPAVQQPPAPSNPTPSIGSLFPSSLPVNSNPQPITISGGNFLASATVSFNGSNHAATFVSGQELTIDLSKADLDAIGTYPVVVTNPGPGGGASNAETFAVQGGTRGSNQWTASRSNCKRYGYRDEWICHNNRLLAKSRASARKLHGLCE